MEQPIIKTLRCVLRPATDTDARWMYKLFNDRDVVSYIEGIKWFNSNIKSTQTFIDSMNINFQKGLGILWCILYENCPIGMIMVNDLNEESFYTFALFPKYRGLELMKECIAATNRYLLETYQQVPGITSIDSNTLAIRLIQKISLFSPNNYTKDCELI